MISLEILVQSRRLNRPLFVVLNLLNPLIELPWSSAGSILAASSSEASSSDIICDVWMGRKIWMWHTSVISCVLVLGNEEEYHDGE